VNCNTTHYRATSRCQTLGKATTKLDAMATQTRTVEMSIGEILRAPLEKTQVTAAHELVHCVARDV